MRRGPVKQVFRKPSVWHCGDKEYDKISYIVKGYGKAYVGRTTRSLRVRTKEHRVKYYKLLSGDKVDETSDEYSLGLHLLDHGFKQRDDFNKIFNVSIIDNSSPKTLEVREHKYIQLLKTLKPLGINTINPFGLPLLLTS